MRSTLLLLLVSCSTPPSTPVEPGQVVGSSTATTPTALADHAMVDVGQLVAETDPVVVDVRVSRSYSGGHVPGAVWADAMNLRPGQSVIDGLPKDRVVFIIAGTDPGAASAAQVIGATGRVARGVLGGMEAYVATGQPVEKSVLRDISPGRAPEEHAH